MNKVAIRILMRMIDVLVEQTDEVKYAHKTHTKAFEALQEAVKNLRKSKTLLIDLVETND